MWHCGRQCKIINQHARDSYQQAQNLLGAQAHYWIRDRRDEGIELAHYIQLRRDGFRQVFPLVELEVSTGDGNSISIIATDLLALSSDYLDAGDDGEDSSESWLKFVQPPYRAWVPQVLADELGITEGQQLQLRDGRQLPPALVQSRERQGRRVLVDVGAALELSGSDRLSYLAVGQLSPTEFGRLSQRLPPQLELVENQHHIDLTELTQSLHTHLTAMSLLSFAVGLFIVFNAVRFSLWYRRSTLLNLRLLGCANRTLMLAIALETVVWSLLGTGLGFVAGILLALGLLPGLGASLQSLFGAVVETGLVLSLWTLLQAWCIALFGLLWALAWPLYRQLPRRSLEAARMDTLSADEALARRMLGQRRFDAWSHRGVCLRTHRDGYPGFRSARAGAVRRSVDAAVVVVVFAAPVVEAAAAANAC